MTLTFNTFTVVMLASAVVAVVLSLISTGKASPLPLGVISGTYNASPLQRASLYF